ncbi:MAG: iron-containing alcohol dehydrogenase [Lachnospiraceae bacterium]|nr:iron-containing alcohol dehydrogenase [Lachnospiraceae bacterium]
MKFFMPVKVFDEKDCVLNHADEIGALGKKALIVTGKGSAFSNGSYDDVIAALKKQNTEYLTFSEVEENPSTDTVFEAVKRFSPENPDFVIGIGGGSPMDAAKAIALGLKHPEADIDYLYDASKDASALPLVCVPTTCGTGSEVTGVSVLTRHDKKTKASMVHKVFPAYALIDCKYLSSAPHSLIVNSSMDALSHLLESVLNAKADDYVRMTAEAGLKMWEKTKDILTGDRKAGEDDLGLLMRSSCLAGMSIAQSGTTIPHSLSYTVTYDLSVPHGKAVSRFLPGYLAAAPEKERDELLKLSGFSGLDEFTGFVHRVFGDMEIPKEELQRSYEAVKDNTVKMKSASFELSHEVLRKIVFYGQDTI